MDGGMDGDNLPFRPSEHTCIINFKAIAGYGPVKVSTKSMEDFWYGLSAARLQVNLFDLAEGVLEE